VDLAVARQRPAVAPERVLAVAQPAFLIHSLPVRARQGRVLPERVR
jgi:hypothetical protein